MNFDRVIRPQPSERWAMYRLICPLVDAACDISGLEPYFEFSRPNGPNKRLSADIALMQDERPVWLIEAKKYGRKVDPGMVDAYLQPGMMGVVTNGNHWIFKVSERYLSLGPLLLADGRIDKSVHDKICALLTSSDADTALAQSDKWVAKWVASTAAAGPKLWQLSGGKGERAYHPKTRYETLTEAAQAAVAYVSPGSMPALLLNEIIATGQEIALGYLELNPDRMIWWAKEGMRAARVKLTGEHLELLAHNSLLEAMGRESVRVSIKMHDKNTKMSVLKASAPEEVRGLRRLFNINPLTRQLPEDV